MTDLKIIFAVLASTAVIIIGGILLASKLSSSPQVESSSGAKVKVEKTSHDWGEVGIKNGKVEASFEIENTGEENLKLYNVKTSCDCTTAQLSSGNNTSPSFGMHDNSSYILEVPPKIKANLKVVFDPAYHGPDSVGPITRQINIQTNDKDQTLLSFILSGTVVR